MRTKDWCIGVINGWLNTIEATAIDGELKLTKKGTALLEDNLAMIREYLTGSDDK